MTCLDNAFTSCKEWGIYVLFPFNKSRGHFLVAAFFQYFFPHSCIYPLKFITFHSKRR